MTLTPQQRDQLRRDAIRRERLGLEALYQAAIPQLIAEKQEQQQTPIVIDLTLRPAA